MPQRRPGHKAPSGPPTGRGFCFDSRSSWPGLAFPNSHFVVSPSWPGLTRQSITFVKVFVKIDGCPGQARARRVCAHQPQFQTATLFAATASRSRRTCASFALNIATLKSEGAGNAGRPPRPQPRVQRWKAHELVTTVTPRSPGIPRAMVLTVSFVLSPVIGLLSPSPAD
jgi:hypothetical protein